MVGAGALAPYLVRAHAAVRPIKRVTLWNRTRGNAVQARLRARGRRHRGRGRRRSRSRGARGRHRLLRDALGRAARARQVAQEGRASRSRRRLSRRRCARPTTTRSSSARVYVDTRAGAPKEAGDIAQPLKSRRAEEGRDPRRPVRALPRQGQGPHGGQPDHAVQVGRHRDRGSGGRDAGVAGSGRNAPV